LVASSDKIDLWETFNIVNLGNSRAAFQAVVNGNFVCAESAGASPLIANRDTIGLWETFIIVAVDKGIALKS